MIMSKNKIGFILVIVVLIVYGNITLFTSQLGEKINVIANNTEKRFGISKDIGEYVSLLKTVNSIDTGLLDETDLMEYLKIKILCFDMITEYKNKHDTIKEYFNLLTNNDETKVAESFLNEADGLIKKDKNESIMLYRYIIKEFPALNIIPSVHLKLGKIFDEEQDLRSALTEYQRAIKSSPDDLVSKEATISCGRIYMELNENKKAIELLDGIIPGCEENELKENAIYTLGRAYYNNGETKNAKDTFGTYLEKYPNGKYASSTKFLLKGLQ